MPWDLIFYGTMAITFIGIMLASARARREQGGAGCRSGPAIPGSSPDREDGTDGPDRSASP